MKTDCPFLERLRRPQIRGIYGCGAGINFYPVGQDRKRCQVCTIAPLGRLPDCQHLYANSWLLTHSDRTPFVELELLCGLTGDPLYNLHGCTYCPERLPQSAGLSQPVLAPTLAG